MRRTTLDYAPPAALPRTAGLRRMRAWVAPLAGEQTLVFGLMLLGLVAQGLNMFHYPAFSLLDDEGIYAEQAWAVLTTRGLAPYTYFYDHAPAGWIQIALWYRLTGGIHTFGTVIDSGRVFMLVLHVAMVPLLYRLARKLGGSVPAAAFGVALFSLSPLAIFYQRMLLLDTVMLFWLLLSLDLLLDGWGRLSRVALSGCCFGLAALSKETAVFLLPAMLYLVVQQRWRHQANFAVSGWVLPMLIVVSWYPLYALLKGELFPSGSVISGALGSETISGSAGAHVSLLDALLWQSLRTGGGMLNFHNQFWTLVRSDWLVRDPVLLVGGVVATGLNLVRGVRSRQALAAGLLGACSLFYLARGGLVLNYYVLLAIPFLCLNLALLVSALLERLPNVLAVSVPVVALGGLVAGYLHVGAFQPLFQQRPDTAARAAISWIKQHVPAQSTVITRDNVWTDLRAPGEGGPAFPFVESHWKVAADPAIKGGVFKDTWRTVDYVLLSPGLRAELTASNDTVTLAALAHAHLVKTWTAAPGDKALQPQQIFQLYKVDQAGQTETHNLASSASYLQAHFEHAGAYVDAGGAVTSEAEAYALLRDVWSNNRTDFAQTWNWTQGRLLNTDGLLAWQWQNGKATSANSASDADSDAALALLLASKRWSDPAYLAAGRQLVQAIWAHEVVQVGQQPYLTAGNWATSGAEIALDPSYFSPAAYHIFQAVDPDHNWNGVVTSSYTVLFNASKQTLGSATSAGLPPDWVGLDRSSGALVPLQIPKEDPTGYGYDAARSFWRVALDWQWDHDGRAKSFLDQAGFLKGEVQRKGYVSAVYGHSGSVKQTPPSLVGDAGALSALLTLDPAVANQLYASQLVGGVQDERPGIAWGDPNDLYSQEWGWFGTALYAGALPDLWLGPKAGT